MKSVRFTAFVLTLCAISGSFATATDIAVGEDHCYPVPEYDGINAVPAVTMQIHPSTGGDTVVNDAEYPPGTGLMVVVGFWEQPEGYQPAPGENPCAGEPTMKIAYPLAYGTDQCYGWKHWHDGDEGLELHENSAKNFSCDDQGTFHYTQWTTMTCEGSEEVGPEGSRKSASPRQCCRDMPPTIYSQILSGCGKKPPRSR